MGEVYRARDTKLGRDIALKILPSSFTNDPERVGRFRREAQVLASLNHPHIGAIYGLDEANGTQFLVLELVDGESLDKRIARGPIPVDDALGIAKQIAEALEAAHEKGIIHRDLKPANIALTVDGQTKVLDFGLAKAVESVAVPSDLSISPTITSPAMMTGVGMILGTAAYMAPEQAKGRSADKRSDIWAFGCTLYEMLTGKRAFEGNDVSDILAAVLRGEPDWTALPANTPRTIRRLIERCLAKERQQRVADMSTARYVLTDTGVSDPATAFTELRPLWKRVLSLTAVVLFAATLGGTVAWTLRPSAPPALMTRFPLVLAQGQGFNNFGRYVITISPDGSQIVYAANSGLYRRSMGSLDARPIAGTENWSAVLEPVFSPDGLTIAFWASDQTLKKIGVNGGTAVTLCPIPTAPFGMSWGTDGLVFGHPSGGIFRVSPNGGQPELLVKLKENEVAQGPQVLSDGQTVLFTLATGTGADRWDTAQIVTQSLRSGERRVVLTGSDARYLPTGHLVYALGGVVFAARFDLSRLAVIGAATPVIEGVRRAPGIQSGAAHFSVSNTGSLIYLAGPAQSNQRLLAEVDRATGHLTLLKLPPGSYLFPRYAPRDGGRVAFEVDEGKQQTIAVYDLSGATTMRRLTLGGANRFPIWSADGQRIAYQSDREGDRGIFWQRADGTGAVERLTKPESGMSHVPDSWSPDGQTLLFEAVREGRFTLRSFSVRDGKDEQFGSVQSSIAIDAAFSSNGHWVAYDASQAGFAGARVYVEPFPRTGAIYLAPSNGLAASPLWPAGTKSLLYDVAPNFFSVVTFSTQPSVEFGNPEPVVKGGLERPGFTNPRPWDLSPDGTRILGVLNGVPTEGNATATIQVVLNWFDELKHLVPMK
jgi:serine/threonine-protein kinase